MVCIFFFILISSLALKTSCHEHFTLSHDDILYYEILDTSQITHTRVRRSFSETNHIRHVRFQTHQQSFTLHLRQNSDILTDDFQARYLDAALFDANSLYQGYVNKDYTSDVLVYIHDDVVAGIIMTTEENYHIELLRNHVIYAPANFMIVYKESNLRNKHVLYSKIDGNLGMRMVTLPDEMVERPSRRRQERIRRTTELPPGCKAVPPKNLCPVYLVADYTFFKEVGNLNKMSTVYHMLQAIRVADKLLKETIWNDGTCRVGLAVKGVHVYETDDKTTPRFNWESTRSPEEHEPFLYWFQRGKKKLPGWKDDDFCLAHLFTYRDFTKGVLGLAYIGTEYSFGICNNQNVAFSNYYNSARNTRLITQQAYLVTAHEIAHNFGSRHDNLDYNDPGCHPGGDDGNYLMFDRIISSTKPNNNKLSTCSKQSISALLKYKLQDCFIQQNESLCSNGVVEKNEDCDAGIFGENDPCCDPNCQFKDGAVCSNFNDECCTNCSFTKNLTKICRNRDDNSCHDNVYCNGKSAKCPSDSTVLIVDNNITCNFGRGNCTEKGCIPLCQLKGMVDCSCSSIGLNSCFLCCKDTKTEECIRIRPQWDGSRCTIDEETGTCKNAQCHKVKDEVTLLKDFSLSKFGRFLKENIVGTIAVFSLFFWAPVACFVHYLDKQQEEENVFVTKWRHPSNSELMLDRSARRRLRHLFKKDTGSAKRVSGGRFHISS